MMSLKNVYIIRHGQTDVNLQKKLQGRSDIPMNDTGRAQAGVIRDYFAENEIVFDKAWSSPLARAVETAKIVIGGTIPVLTDDRLTEMDYGPYEGISFANPPKEIVTFFSDFVHNPAPEGMETLASVVERAGDFIESIRNTPAKTILISTHAIAMKGILEYLTPDSNGMYWSKHIGNCSIYRVEIHDGKFSVPVQVLNYSHPTLSQRIDAIRKASAD